MKKILYIVPVLLLANFSSHYTLVDEPPLGPTEASYFSSVNEFRAQLTGVYAAIYDDYHFAANGYNGWVQWMGNGHMVGARG